MYNLVHYFIGFLAELGFITQEGAQAIDRELSPQIISSNAQEAFKQVHDAMEKVSKDLNLRGDLVKIEPWLAHIELLEKRVAALEGKHSIIQKDFTGLLSIVKEKLSPIEKEVTFSTALTELLRTIDKEGKKLESLTISGHKITIEEQANEVVKPIKAKVTGKSGVNKKQVV